MSISKTGIITSFNNVSYDIYNGQYANGELPIYVPVERITRTNHDWYTNYRFSVTKPTSDSWYHWNSDVFTFDVGSTYLWKCMIRCNECTAGATISMRAARSSNDWVTSGIIVCSNNLADKKWHEYYRTQIVNSTYNRSNTTITCAPLFEMYTSNLSSASTDIVTIDFDICNVQVMKSSTNLPVNTFYEVDDQPAGIGTDFVRSKQFYEI